MKKILVSLLTVAMLFTIGATNVFADGPDYGKESGIGGGEIDDAVAGRQFNEDEKSAFTTVNVRVKKAKAPESHEEYFKPNGIDNPDAMAVYKLAFTWKVNGGWYTEQATWKWNPDTAKYENVKENPFTLDHNPNVTLKVTNKSNKDVWYKVSATESTEHPGYTAENALNAFNMPYAADQKFDALAVGRDATEATVLDHVDLVLNSAKEAELKAELAKLADQGQFEVAKVTITFCKNAPAQAKD